MMAWSILQQCTYISYRTLFAISLFSILSEGDQTIQMKKRNQLMMPVL